MLSNINKITILSGGSGNDAILKALFDMGYTDKDIRIIVNAYDDGKSTGVCREVTGTLGVSDIRKNHEKIHKMIYGDNQNKDFMFFYENRLDLSITNNIRTGNPLLDREIDYFFSRYKAKYFDYSNFNLMNIIYSQLYSSIGYEATNSMFSSLLGIDDMVKLNSFDNIKIVATTMLGNIITDEGDIVEFKSDNDYIDDIHFVGKKIYGLNIDAINIIKESDLIIISTGTFWSSIYPTLKYCDLYKCINENHNKKLWVVNSEQDKDAWGVGFTDFYDELEGLGLDMRGFDILINTQADRILREGNIPFHKTIKKPLGNIDGRNDYKLVREALEEIYV